MSDEACWADLEHPVIAAAVMPVDQLTSGENRWYLGDCCQGGTIKMQLLEDIEVNSIVCSPGLRLLSCPLSFLLRPLSQRGGAAA